ncbi:MULE transposase domain [Popillia japonica]|uniref:MULE transposase domain n=1 Tax=Popillia japonica TaxID=7064 RepID=A0AAW1HSS3_POPJA
MDCSLGLPPKTCPHCSKTFSSVKVKNRHIKRVHQVAVEGARRSLMLCSLCADGSEVKTYEGLRNHVTKENHQTNKTNKSKQIYTPSIARGLKNLVVGTIKIHGVCPSKLIVKIHDDGKVNVNFWKTHVGHKEDELRCQHLSTIEKNMVVGKLKSGVSTDRILKDARELKMSTVERINLLSKKDISYLSRKYNIEKRRDNNEMVAATLKVQEWNASGRNFAFFFKQQGETHDVLKKEDFALGFMNSTMEDKLRNFPNIICMDGTHGTNRRGMDLTIVLIKDDKNAGFPVAFFLSNRLDQVIQEVFLGALRAKIQQAIRPGFFMSDDDPKYYNAWVSTMGSKPRRLLCTWHVVKNWNIQGKKKISNPELRKKMKVEMKRILNETNKERFWQLVNTYLEKLQEANEVEFMNYLLTYYFQGEERIQMWAHCYRKNAEINTNMAIESLNNLLKTNQLKRKNKITIEKLLDTIQKLVDIKMWQRVLNIERPNANNYQDRIIIKAHKKAEAEKSNIKVFEKVGSFREYQVKSSTEYMVRNTMCKHVHLVQMHEERKDINSVLDNVAEALGQNSQVKVCHQEEIAHFVQDKRTEQVGAENIEGALNQVDRRRNNEATTTKRKMEKQQYFPAKKRNIE